MIEGEDIANVGFNRYSYTPLRKQDPGIDELAAQAETRVQTVGVDAIIVDKELQAPAMPATPPPTNPTAQ